MFSKKHFAERSKYSVSAKFVIFAILSAGIAYLPVLTRAQEPGQKTFSSPSDGAKELIKALKANDQPALLNILGPDAKAVVSSGDDVEDKNDRDQFVEKYQEMHRIVNETDGKTTIYIGSENWPSPIPLVKTNGRWYFDTAAGKQEILYRRIGKNELAVIQVCRELVDAEREYSAKAHDGRSAHRYAHKFFSDPGKHNGLYWPVTSGEDESPIGPLVASAATEGYKTGASEEQQPFQGYYFRILSVRANVAEGGGFAFVAYPADYRSSGVMTFIVDQSGTVYEKDLGRRTSEIAKSLTRQDRDTTWHKAL